MNINKYTYIIFIILGLFITSLIIILYNTYIYKNELEAYHNFGTDDNKIKETFVNYGIDNYKKPYGQKVNEMYNTTLENYKAGVDFHNNDKNNYYNYNDYRDVKNDSPFLTYGCIKNNKSNNILEDLRSLFYVSYYEFYSVSINDIIEKVMGDLEIIKRKINGQELKDPIYILVYQAPNLSFNDESYMARHDSVNNLKASYKQNKEGVKIGSQKLYTKLYIMYPYYYHDPNNSERIINYSANGKIDDGLNKFKEYFNNKITRDKLCFIECNGVNDYACGCLNTNNTKCIDIENNYYNYGMVYTINKFNPLYSKYIKNRYL